MARKQHPALSWGSDDIPGYSEVSATYGWGVAAIYYDLVADNIRLLVRRAPTISVARLREALGSAQMREVYLRMATAGWARLIAIGPHAVADLHREVRERSMGRPLTSAEVADSRAHAEDIVRRVQAGLYDPDTGTVRMATGGEA